MDLKLKYHLEERFSQSKPLWNALLITPLLPRHVSHAHYKCLIVSFSATQLWFVRGLNGDGRDFYRLNEHDGLIGSTISIATLGKGLSTRRTCSRDTLGTIPFFTGYIIAEPAISCHMAIRPGPVEVAQDPVLCLPGS
ncbi:hypothetical protein PoB_001667300 [Plakobranchus ocellatus]|uniref:Uncharacterized protein n=1 Tax=Plakobranchus ocellatus TaxID=259542 RepID=A0AAV3Z628_9GAST|nr:hypothetical protein PoB_001667300 [Plakobranchus ocellatus]